MLTLMIVALLAQAAPAGDPEPTPPRDGPFGLWAGMSKAEVEKLGPLVKMSTRPSAWSTMTVPRSDPRFNRYYLTVGQKAGLCQVVAFTPPGSADAFGDAMRASFKDIEAVISGIYGPSERIDRLKPGSIWSEPREWMMGLLKGERVLASTWQSPGANMRNRLTRITISAHAKSSDTGFLALGYTFDTMPGCDADDAEAAGSVF